MHARPHRWLEVQPSRIAAARVASSDTNVLAYADSADAPAKQARATALIAEHLRDGSGVISTQVLHEFVNAAIRKLALPLDIVRARVRLYEASLGR